VNAVEMGKLAIHRWGRDRKQPCVSPSVHCSYHEWGAVRLINGRSRRTLRIPKAPGRLSST